MKRIIQVLSLAWACLCLTWLSHAQAQPSPQPANPPATPATGNTANADDALREVLRQTMATNAPAPLPTNLQRRLRQPRTSAPGRAAPTIPVPAAQPPTTPAAIQPVVAPATQTPLIAPPGTANTPAAQTVPAAQVAPPTVTTPPTVTAQPPGTTPATAPPGPAAVAPGRPEEAMIPSGLSNPDDIVETITFANMALDQVLDYYASLSGRTILKPQALAATITLKTQNKLTRREALQALDSVLALNGVTMIPVGEKFVKAVAPQQALLEGTAFSKFSHDQLPEADQFVTHIVQLKNANPVEVIPIIQGLAKNPAGILGIEATRMIVLRDYAANVKRMLEVIDRVDIVPEMDYKLEVIPIKFGRVEEIYATMSSLIGGAGGGAAVPGAAGAARRTTASRAGSGSRLGGMQQRYGQQQLGQQPGQPAAPAASQGSFQDRLRQIVNRAAGGDMQLLGDAKIVPDERSNTLIVFANKQDMEMITNIVSKVDVLLAQVLIEAIIVDVGMGSNWSVGVSTLQHPRSDGNVSHAGVANNGQNFLQNITNFPGSLGGGFSYLAQYRDDFSVALQAIAADNKAQVVQTPRIQTSHAVPASFFNGETRPYPTSSYGGYGGGIGIGGGYPSISYQQLEVGVGIEVTPYITPDDLVVMEITQTIDGIIGTEELANIGKVPITSRRTATATVSVRNKDTILLGGFINSQKTKSKSGVPLLKDIPVLGALFRTSSDDTKRSELIILMRPTILQTPQDAALAAKAERERLPGIVDAEKRFQEDTEKRFNEKKKW